MSPSRTIMRVANGKSVTDTGPMTFRNTVDEGNVMGLNPKKPKTDDSAAAMEAERQARISANVGNINSAFAGREGQYAAFADALRKKYTGDLTRQYDTAGRNLKFELAGAGLTGGSAAKDQGADLARQMTEGTVAAEQQVGSAEAGLRSADENARMQMISLAQAGGDIGNAATQTGNMLRANYDANTAGAKGLGDVFGGTAATYKAMQEARNLRRGLSTAQDSIYGVGLGRPYGGK